MIQIFTTGGTIDKVYFDANSEFEVGHSLLPELLSESNIHEGYRLRELLRKDSLEMTDDDRQQVLAAASECDCGRIIITHGTDTMVDTARVLAEQVEGKTIVLTGAMIPIAFIFSDCKSAFSIFLRSVISMSVVIVPIESPVRLFRSELCTNPGKTVPSRRTRQISPLKLPIFLTCSLAFFTPGS